MSNISSTSEPVYYTLFIISEDIILSAHRNANRSNIQGSLKLFW
jgi:hypothetical protein